MNNVTTNKTRFEKNLYIAQLAMLIALTLLMGLTPLGTIHTPFLSVSLVTIPVALAAILLGPVGGLVCGGVFGLTSSYNAIKGVGMMGVLFQVMPFGALFTAIVPRLLEGLLVGLIFAGLSKIKPLKIPAYYISAICCPLLNTLLFMSSLIAFFWNSDYVQSLAADKGAANPFMFVILLVGVQGVIEAVTGCILGGSVALAVSKAVKGMSKGSKK